MLENLYYTLGIVAILWELMCLFNAKTVNKFVRNYKRSLKLNYELTSEQSFYRLLGAFFIIWITFGLWTEHWRLFIIIAFIHLMPQNRTKRRRLVSFFTLILLLMMYFSKYELLTWLTK